MMVKYKAEWKDVRTVFFLGVAVGLFVGLVILGGLR